MAIAPVIDSTNVKAIALPRARFEASRSVLAEVSPPTGATVHRHPRQPPDSL